MIFEMSYVIIIDQLEGDFLVEVERIKCGNANVYLLNENNNSILVDTSRVKYKKEILEKCKQKNTKLIILTHGHIDHVQNAAFLSKKLNIPIAMHKGDLELIKDNNSELMLAHTLLGKLLLLILTKSFKKDKIESFEPIFLKDGDVLKEYGINATVVELSGHTKGSIGIKTDNNDFIVGDALMNLIYPTKTMIYGNKKKMEESANKITLSNANKIYFGHGKPSKNHKW
jgi:glyoxylase-like metal-dependent hydrolase (beta-lactamase superfamily II)